MTKVKVDLDYPFDYDGKTYKSVELSRPKGKHLKNFSTNPGISDMMALAAKISGEFPQVFDEMDASDFMKVSEVIGDFLGGGRQTGK